MIVDNYWINLFSTQIDTLYLVVAIATITLFLVSALVVCLVYYRIGETERLLRELNSELDERIRTADGLRNRVTDMEQRINNVEYVQRRTSSWLSI